MSFHKRDEDGNIIRRKVVIDCQAAIENGEKVHVEQNHRDKVEINNIVNKHGISRLIATRQAQDLIFDENPTNDFQEAMNLLKKGRDVFMQLSSKERAEFNNDPAQYLDYVQNPANKEALIERGWAKAPPPPEPPVKVEVTNPVTPTETA
jgi:hypothetical protein